MKSLRTASLVALAVFGAWHAADARATDPSKFYVTMTGHHVHASGAVTDNLITFSVPVQVPHATLPAGTYRFQFLTPSLVRVTDVNRTKVYATFTTVPVSRNVPPNRGQARFQRLDGDQPLRLIAWYLYGNSTGSQPLYRKVHKPERLPATNTSTN